MIHHNVRHTRSRGVGAWLTAAAVLAVAAPLAAQDRPNILVIWGDDIGQYNISAYNRGAMGYMTPNIDRIASEGILFTDSYGENSCTAGRSAFMTGQSPFRTGLTKVGFPGATQGIQPEDPTIAEMLKPLGYRTGQFGKNHLGDLDEHLPTNHGFDEFYGNLYHLNAEEEPENPDYPADFVTGDGRTMAERYGPRGVIHSYADGRIEDTGAPHPKAYGVSRRRVPRGGVGLHRSGQRRGRAILRVVRVNANARLDPPKPRSRRGDRSRHLCGRHGRARRSRGTVARQARRARGSPRTRSSCTPPTTGRSS